MFGSKFPLSQITWMSRVPLLRGTGRGPASTCDPSRHSTYVMIMIVVVIMVTMIEEMVMMGMVVMVMVVLVMVTIVMVMAMVMVTMMMVMFMMVLFPSNDISHVIDIDQVTLSRG